MFLSGREGQGGLILRDESHLVGESTAAAAAAVLCAAIVDDDEDDEDDVLRDLADASNTAALLTC